MAKIQKYKVTSGYRWRVRWVIEGEQKSKTFSKWGTADKFRKSVEHSLQEGTYTEPSDITLSAFLSAWINAYKINLSPSTESGYRVNIRHIESVLGSKKLQRLNPADIERMYTYLLQPHPKLPNRKKKSNEKALSNEKKESSEKNSSANKKNEPELQTLSATSVLYIHRVLSRALKQAVKQRIINSNPCAFVDPPKKKKEQGAQFIHPNDVSKYLAAFDGSYMYPAVCLALFCGLRRGEVLALQWADIKNGAMTVRHNMTYTGMKAPKSGCSRTIPITPPIKAMLQAQREKQRHFKELLWNKYHKSDFIVTYDDGQQIDPRVFSKLFHSALVSADLPVVRFHDLRHTAASLMIMEGVDMKTVSEVLGHQSIKITADIYGHIADEHKLDAMSRLNKYQISTKPIPG